MGIGKMIRETGGRVRVIEIGIDQDKQAVEVKVSQGRILAPEEVLRDLVPEKAREIISRMDDKVESPEEDMALSLADELTDILLALAFIFI